MLIYSTVDVHVALVPVRIMRLIGGHSCASIDAEFVLLDYTEFAHGEVALT